MLKYGVFPRFLRDGTFAHLLNEMKQTPLESAVGSVARRGYPQPLGRRFAAPQSLIRSSKTGASTEQNGRGRFQLAKFERGIAVS